MKIRILTAALAAFLILPLLGVTAYAYAPPDEVIATEEQPVQEDVADTPDAPVTDYPETPPRPFTPAGTGTVVDNATDGDGKEFYTIITPGKNVFYLVIDRQRGQENVYFLNAVTEADLLSLAQMPEKPAPVITEQPPSPVEPEPTPAPAPEQNGGGNTGMIVLLVVIAIGGGGAGWYFKVYKPKQQQAESDDDYAADESDLYGGDDQGIEPEDDGPPWYGEDETPDGDDNK